VPDVVRQVELGQVPVDQVVDQVLLDQVEAHQEELDAVPRAVRVVAGQAVRVEVDRADVALVNVVHHERNLAPDDVKTLKKCCHKHSPRTHQVRRQFQRGL